MSTTTAGWTFRLTAPDGRFVDFGNWSAEHVEGTPGAVEFRWSDNVYELDLEARPAAVAGDEWHSLLVAKGYTQESPGVWSAPLDELDGFGKAIDRLPLRATGPAAELDDDPEPHFVPLPEIEGWERMPGGVPTYKRTSDGVLMIQKTDVPINRSSGTVGLWCATSGAKGRLTLDRETTAEVIADLADFEPPATATAGEPDSGAFCLVQWGKHDAGLAVRRGGLWSVLWLEGGRLFPEGGYTDDTWREGWRWRTLTIGVPEAAQRRALARFQSWARKAAGVVDPMSDDELRAAISGLVHDRDRQGRQIGHWHEVARRIVGDFERPANAVAPLDAQLRALVDAWLDDTLPEHGRALSSARHFRQWARAHSGLPTEATDDELRAALTARLSIRARVAAKLRAVWR